MPQVSRGLEKRTELESRKSCPGLWKLTDRLTAQDRTQQKRSKGMPALCMALGVFLLVPGLMEPRNWLLIVSGLLGVGFGLLRLLPGKKKSSTFDRCAAKLLEQIGAYREGEFQVLFRENGMTVADHPDDRQETAAYDDLEQVLVTEDLYLVIFREKAMVLQKKDLQNEEADEFTAFLKGKTPVYEV